VQVLGAVAHARLRDEVVGVEVFVLVLATIDGERASGGVVTRFRLVDVRLDRRDVHEL
jgi:hypothetical protein